MRLDVVEGARLERRIGQAKRRRFSDRAIDIPLVHLDALDQIDVRPRLAGGRRDRTGSAAERLAEARTRQLLVKTTYRMPRYGLGLASWPSNTSSRWRATERRSFRSSYTNWWPARTAWMSGTSAC